MGYGAEGEEEEDIPMIIHIRRCISIIDILADSFILLDVPEVTSSCVAVNTFSSAIFSKLNLPPQHTRRFPLNISFALHVHPLILLSQ
jgi:hypothetical protein